MDPLFPQLPENLAELADEDLMALLTEHQTAAEMVEAQDEEFLKGLTADEIVEQYNAGVEQIEAIVAEQKRRKEAEETYTAELASLRDRRLAALAAEDEGDGEGDGDGDEGDGGEGDSEGEGEGEPAAQLAAETEGDGEGDGDGDGEGEGEPAGEPENAPAALSSAPAATATVPATRPVLRRPPAPSAEREARGAPVAPLIAAAGLSGVRGGKTLDRHTLADTMKKLAQSLGAPAKTEGGIEQRFHIAQAQFTYPEDRVLAPGELDTNTDKIRKIIPPGIPGVPGIMVASGGLCAPLEPIYTMPNFATQARPVRDALPSFQAERGGVNVPTATTIGDITTAISVITEAEDALGGTFATKSCQDLDCPAFVETAVTVLAHCREYGNLNARAWPEKIAHENDLTMAAHSRTADGYLLAQIKALSIALTNAKVIGAYADLVRTLMQARSAIVNVLRMDNGVTFRALAPEWLGNLLAADVAATAFDRYQNQAAMTAHLASLGFAINWYKDSPGSGTSQMFANASAGVLAKFPTAAQIAVFPEGEFIHIDSGTLDLGIVRDSSLNSTNDFQVFGETFENVARLGPAQAAYWLTVSLCPTGEFPSLATAYTC